MAKRITSLQNPLIKEILSLQEKSRERKSKGSIIIEGTREIDLAGSAGFSFSVLLFCPEILSKDQPAFFDKEIPGDPEMIECPREVYNRLAYRENSQGIIAVAQTRHLQLNDLTPGKIPLYLVLETVEKPGNLGAMLRTADAAGLDAVIICDPKTDLYNPNVIRSSIGCVFTVPVVVITSQEAIDWFKEKQVSIYATALTATEYYHHADFSLPSAIIMGSEASGLSSLWLGHSKLIKIPMLGRIDSMNVSVSAAIVVFEALRQRGFDH